MTALSSARAPAYSAAWAVPAIADRVIELADSAAPPRALAAESADEVTDVEAALKRSARRAATGSTAWTACTRGVATKKAVAGASSDKRAGETTGTLMARRNKGTRKRERAA